MLTDFFRYKLLLPFWPYAQLVLGVAKRKYHEDFGKNTQILYEHDFGIVLPSKADVSVVSTCRSSEAECFLVVDPDPGSWLWTIMELWKLENCRCPCNFPGKCPRGCPVALLHSIKMHQTLNQGLPWSTFIHCFLLFDTMRMFKHALLQHWCTLVSLPLDPILRR